jgi:hypothetical protein
VPCRRELLRRRGISSACCLSYTQRPTFRVDLETVNLPIPTALGIRETKIKSFSRISAPIIVSTALDIRCVHRVFPCNCRHFRYAHVRGAGEPTNLANAARHRFCGDQTTTHLHPYPPPHSAPALPCSPLPRRGCTKSLARRRIRIAMPHPQLQWNGKPRFQFYVRPCTCCHTRARIYIQR